MFKIDIEWFYLQVTTLHFILPEFCPNRPLPIIIEFLALSMALSVALSVLICLDFVKGGNLNIFQWVLNKQTRLKTTAIEPDLKT